MFIETAKLGKDYIKGKNVYEIIHQRQIWPPSYD
jgi:hypothetical protein